MKADELLLFLRWRYAPEFEGVGDGALLDRYFTDRDESALRALVARHAGQLFNLCRVELGDLDLAEDAFQDTVVALHCHGRALRDSQAVSAWLLTTARRVCRALRRREARRRATEKVAAAGRAGGAAESADAEALREEVRRRVADAVGSLPDRYGVPLHLGLQGLTPDEIAGRLNLPVPTVKTRITRGRRLLLGRFGAKQLAVAAAAWTSGRAEAVPAALLATAVRAALAPGAVPRVAMGGTWRWAWAWVAAAGLVAGGTGWALTSRPAAQTPAPPAIAAAESDEEIALRLFRDRVLPEVVEAAKGLLIGGGEVRASDVELVDGTRLSCRLDAAHNLGFRSAMTLRYQPLNGALSVRLDQFGTGRWKSIDPLKPVRVGIGDGNLATIDFQAFRRLKEAFRVIPLRPPPDAPPGAAVSDWLRPYLGRWCFAGEREYPSELIYLDAAGRGHRIDRFGRHEVWEPRPLDGGLHAFCLLRLDDGGRVLRCDNPKLRWVRDDAGPP